MKRSDEIYQEIYNSIDFLEDVDIAMRRVVKYGKQIAKGENKKAIDTWWLLYDSMNFIDDINAVMKLIGDYGKAVKSELDTC